MNLAGRVEKLIRITLLCGVLLILELCYVPLLKGSSIDRNLVSKNQEIQRLLNEKKDTHLVLKRIKTNEYRVLEVLKVIDTNVKKSIKVIDELNQQISTLNQSISSTRKKISGTTSNISLLKENVEKHIEGLFLISKSRQLTPILGLSSFKNFFRNRWLIKSNTKINAEIIQKYQESASQLQVQTEKLNRQLDDQSKLLRMEKEQNELLAFERKQQNTYLLHIRNDRSLRVKYLREIQIELEKLNDVIYSLQVKKQKEKKTQSFDGFRNRKNSLIPPVQGKIISYFGKRNKSKYNLFKRGILIETSDHEEVVSILDGKVVFAGPFRGYDNLIILDHGKGSFSVYGNLEELFVQVGEIVDAKMSLGVVGKDLESEKYLFYFETRKNKRPVNPLQWFKKNAWKKH